MQVLVNDLLPDCWAYAVSRNAATKCVAREYPAVCRARRACELGDDLATMPADAERPGRLLAGSDCRFPWLVRPGSAADGDFHGAIATVTVDGNVDDGEVIEYVPSQPSASVYVVLVDSAPH